MTTLAALRADLTELLTAAGVDTIDHVPEELPRGVIAVLEAADDYLTPGETYSYGGNAEVWVDFVVYVIAELSSNQQATEDLDTALTKAYAALLSSSWEVGSVGKPGPFHTTQWLAHGVAIPVRNITTLTTS